MASSSVFTANNTALITGGASGIGLAVAQLCCRHGMRVAIADLNSEALVTAKGILTGGGVVETHHMDVSDLEQWAELRDEVTKKFGSVDLLMLNAGISVSGRWCDTEYFAKDPDKNSAIVITGSKLGITSQPGCPAYSASKSAVKSLAEHLSFDLRETRTSVHLLVPGWTFTSIGKSGSLSMEEKPPGAWTTEQVADYLYARMAENKFYIICPDNNVTEELDKLRISWSVGDILYDRPALSRWRGEYKDEYEDWLRRQHT